MRSDQAPPPPRRGFLLRSAWILVRPGAIQFFASYRLARDAGRILRDMSKPAGFEADLLDEDQQRRVRVMLTARWRSRAFARLYAALLLIDLALWGRSGLQNGQSLFGMAGLQYLALAAVLGSQLVVQLFTNWKARTSAPGGLAVFLADARNIWPR